MAKLGVDASTSVCPSAAAVAAAAVPMLPPAPGRFSTTKGTPSSWPARSAIRRITRSPEPPAP
jgi:hypothetical protein